MNGASYNVTIIDQNESRKERNVASPMSLIGKCVLSNSKNIPAVGFG
jgi:hypothetical protein